MADAVADLQILNARLEKLVVDPREAKFWEAESVMRQFVGSEKLRICLSGLVSDEVTLAEVARTITRTTF